MKAELRVINMHAQGSKLISSTPKGPWDGEESKRENVCSRKLDLILFPDIGFPSYVA